MKEYILDTNAYFEILRAEYDPDLKAKYADVLKTMRDGLLCISEVTRIEIISVLGKYARGVTGGFQSCGSMISEDGSICQNQRYTVPRKRWHKRKVKQWLKLIDEIHSGESERFHVQVLPLNEQIVFEANKVILHALKNRFGSLDAMIAATAADEAAKNKLIVVITSDKALKQCLKKCQIQYWDPFSETGHFSDDTEFSSEHGDLV